MKVFRVENTNVTLNEIIFLSLVKHMGEEMDGVKIEHHLTLDGEKIGIAYYGNDTLVCFD